MSKVKCISPIDGSVFAERPCLSQNQAFGAIARARAAQGDWARRPLQERIELVRAGVAAIGAMNNEIVPELAHQMGRPIRYGGEYGGFNERASYMADIAVSALAPTEIEDSDNFRRMIKRVPHGVVLVVAPWNYPYMTAINTVAPALIAGNTVVLKHASQTLLVGERMATAFQAAGIPGKTTGSKAWLTKRTSWWAIREDARNSIRRRKKFWSARSGACFYGTPS